MHCGSDKAMLFKDQDPDVSHDLEINWVTPLQFFVVVIVVVVF